MGVLGDGAELVGKTDTLDYLHKSSILGKATPASRDRSDPGIVHLAMCVCWSWACSLRGQRSLQLLSSSALKHQATAAQD